MSFFLHIFVKLLNLNLFKMYNQTFFVDIGETMVGSKNIGQGKDKQKMFCKCGHSQSFDYKIKRSLVKNVDELIEGEESVEKITCKECGRVYDSHNKICLLTPDKEELFYVKFFIEQIVNYKLETINVLYKEKDFVLYDKKSDELIFRKNMDFIKVNTITNDVDVLLNQPLNDNNVLKSEDLQNAIYTNLTLNNLYLLETFFKFYRFVKYEGLECSFEFLKILDKNIVDLDKMKKESFVNFIYNNHKIESIKNKEGDFEPFQMVPSGFGDGKFVKKPLNVGNYLDNLQQLSTLFFSIINLPSLTTVYLTKGYQFLDSFLSSSKVCNRCVYIQHKATHPTKIIEISINYNKIGEPEKETVDTNGEKRSYLKVSMLLYKNINNAQDFKILLEIVSNNILDKKDLETLFQKYDNDRLYKLFGQLTKTRRQDMHLNFEQINHILKYNLDDLRSDFLTTYVDTIRMMGLLEINQKEIFKIKTFKQLKDIHDDYTARYNAVKDLKKAEFYKKSITVFNNMHGVVLDDIEFTIPQDIESLNKEGLKMGHCIYTYLTKVCDQNYLAVHVEHTISNERATMGLIRKGESLEIEQLKGYQNSRASAELINTVIKYCKMQKIKCNPGLVNDLHPQESYRKRMSDYLSDEEVVKIRQDRNNEKEKKHLIDNPQVKKQELTKELKKKENKESISKKTNFLLNLFS